MTLRPLLRRHMGARGMADYAVAPYRQMAWATDAERERWAAADATLHARMHSVVPAALQHNGEEGEASAWSDARVQTRPSFLTQPVPNPNPPLQSLLSTWSAYSRSCAHGVLRST